MSQSLEEIRREIDSLDHQVHDLLMRRAELIVKVIEPKRKNKMHTVQPEREAMMIERVKASGLPLVYAHLVGGQDEVVFDGHSFAVGADAQLAGRAPNFEEKLWFVDVQRAQYAIELKADMAPARALDADLWDALVMGLRDYARKNGFKTVALGLSGGIDSALVLAIAVDALGAENVHAVMMPSPYTAGINSTARCIR